MEAWYTDNRFVQRLIHLSPLDRHELDHFDNAAYSADYALWSMLQKGQLNGYKFERQKRLFGITVSFYCKEARLVIEQEQVDHSIRRREDLHNDGVLNRAGVRVLRFHRDMVLERPLIVKNAILEELARIKQDLPAN